MGVSIYQPPPIPLNEAAREEAVLASGALQARDDVVLLAICAEVCSRLSVPSTLLSVVHGQLQHVIVARGFNTGAYPRKYSFAGHAIAAGEDVFMVGDLEGDERFSDNPWVNGDAARVRFYAGGLLRDQASHAIGVLSAVDRVPRATSSREYEVMLDAAHRAAKRLATLQVERQIEHAVASAAAV